MTRTSIRLSLLAAAACLSLGVAHAQGSSTGNQGASPTAPGTSVRDTGMPATSAAPGQQAQDQDTSAKDLTPGSTVRAPAAEAASAPKSKKKPAKKPASGDTSGTMAPATK